MKHAILIIAYHHIEYVKRLIESFDNDFRIFIHWDKKSELTAEERISLESLPNVNYVGQVYPVNWASYGIVRATLLLCEEALKYQDVTYLHLISDADALIKDLKTFKDFFQENNGTNFLDHKKWIKDGMDRKPFEKIAFYHRLEKYNIRFYKDDNIKYRAELNKQKEAQRYRSLPDIPIYGGSAWWSLTRSCVQYLIDQKEFIEHYYTDTLFPDESFAQTVIMNSPYSSTVANDDLRYICWETRNNSRPAILDKTDLSPIIKSEDLFARKIDPNVSESLLVNIYNIYKKQNVYSYIQESSVEDIIGYLIQSFDPRIQGGLFYGHIGLLILLLVYIKHSGVSNSRYEENILKLLNCVQDEFENTKDESIETGKIGLAIGLEYVMSLDHYPIRDSVTKELDEIHTDILNYVINFCSEESDKKLLPVYNLHFKLRDRNGKLTAIDRSAWKFLQSKMANTQLIPKISNSSIGLTGIAGYGLKLLSQRFGQVLDEWKHLIYP